MFSVLDLGKLYQNDKQKIIVLLKVQLKEMEKLIILCYLRLLEDLIDLIQSENHNNLEGSKEVMGKRIEMISTQEIMIIITETDEIAEIITITITTTEMTTTITIEITTTITIEIIITITTEITIITTIEITIITTEIL